MSEVAAVPLLEAVRKASAAEKAAVLAELLRDELGRMPGSPVIRVPAPSGQAELVIALVGGAGPRSEPPPMTVEDVAELNRRLATLDDAVPLEEIIAEFRRLAAESPPGS